MDRSPIGESSSLATTFDRFRSRFPEALHAQVRGGRLQDPGRHPWRPHPAGVGDVRPGSDADPRTGLGPRGDHPASPLQNGMMMQPHLLGLIAFRWERIAHRLASYTGFGMAFRSGIGSMSPLDMGSVMDGFHRRPHQTAAQCGAVGQTIGALLSGIQAKKMLFASDDLTPSAKIMEMPGDFDLFIAKPKVFFFSHWFFAQGTAIVSRILGALAPPCNSAEDEESGLYFVSHGEQAYAPMTN